MIHAPATTNSPEKQLWFAALGQLLSDFSQALATSRLSEAASLIRQMESEHMQFICETCEIHSDRIRNYMQKRLNEKLLMQNKLETKRN